MRFWVILVALALWLPCGDAYAQWQGRIPNGDRVPHPCKANYIWHGVGHTNSQGGGARNQFGHDFHQAGYQWTEALCGQDSDGDGRTNGQELGDPDCVWRPGNSPPSTSGISHPGVCEPYNSFDCVAKNAWLDCTHDVDFDCPSINEPDVINVTLRIPSTKVPAKETTYICFNFELPDDQEYHLIATTPFIDNRNVMHHIILSACHSHVGLVDKPYECLMGTEGCEEMLGGWTLGKAGECVVPEAGFLVGKGHTKTVAMQLHWTNPELEDAWTDSSGLVLYLTPKLRQNNAAIMIVGQAHLNIPPGQDSWVHSGSCTSRCTSMNLRGEVKIFKSQNHMHLLGIRQNVTLSRPGHAVQVINDDKPFSYDNPVGHVHSPAVSVFPGDQLTTQCTFQSRSRPRTTSYGEGTFDEMCFSFLTFYPAENMPNAVCPQWKELDICDFGLKCDLSIFNSSHPATVSMMEKVLDNCDQTGLTCRPECKRTLEELSSKNGCLKDDTWEYVMTTIMRQTQDPHLMKMVSGINSCRPASPSPHGAGAGDAGDDQGTMTPGKHDDAHTPTHEDPGTMLVNMVRALGSRPLLQNVIMNVNYNRLKSAGKDDHDDSWH